MRCNIRRYTNASVCASMQHPKRMRRRAACVRVRASAHARVRRTVVVEEEEGVGRDGGEVHLAADLVAPEVDRELVGRETPLEAVGQVLEEGRLEGVWRRRREGGRSSSV